MSLSTTPLHLLLYQPVVPHFVDLIVVQKNVWGIAAICSLLSKFHVCVAEMVPSRAFLRRRVSVMLKQPRRERERESENEMGLKWNYCVCTLVWSKKSQESQLFEISPPHFIIIIRKNVFSACRIYGKLQSSDAQRSISLP